MALLEVETLTHDMTAMRYAIGGRHAIVTNTLPYLLVRPSVCGIHWTSLLQVYSSINERHIYLHSFLRTTSA